MVTVPDHGVVSVFGAWNLNHDVTTLLLAINVHKGAVTPQSISHPGRENTFLITEHKLSVLLFWLRVNVHCSMDAATALSAVKFCTHLLMNALLEVQSGSCGRT